jgi:predicted DNA-binding transcriptional regulator YafY
MAEREVVLRLKVNRELLQDIYAFGADVKVISPPWLVAKLREESEKLMAQYS